MKYLHFTQYVYLAACLFFAYSGFSQYQQGEEGYWLWFAIALVCFFMFLFRRRFARKFRDRGNNQQ